MTESDGAGDGEGDDDDNFLARLIQFHPTRLYFYGKYIFLWLSSLFTIYMLSVVDSREGFGII